MSEAVTSPDSTMTSQEVVRVDEESWNYGTWRYQKSWNPLHIVDAEGCYFTDGNGKRYLDFSAQLMCCNLGHKNQAVIKAIEEQARKLAYIMPSYATDTRVELSRLLLEVLPEGLTKFFFTTSGTEANEAVKQDRAHVYRQDQDHCALPFRITGPLWPRSRRLAILVAGPWSPAARARAFYVRRRLISREQMPHPAYLSGVWHCLC